MKLEPLTPEQCEQVRIWRNAEMECWRTPFMLTSDMQWDFYQKRCCDRNSPHRYWAIMGEQIDKINTSLTPDAPAIKTLGYEFIGKFIGMGGITYISWENRIGEITLIINPELRRYSLGEKAVGLLLDQAFNHLNLQTVFAECYACNPAIDFWEKMRSKYDDNLRYLPNRKYYDGRYWASLYISFDRTNYEKKYNKS